MRMSAGATGIPHVTAPVQRRRTDSRSARTGDEKGLQDNLPEPFFLNRESATCFESSIKSVQISRCVISAGG